MSKFSGAINAYHRHNNSDLPSRCTTLIREVLLPSLSEVDNMRCTEQISEFLTCLDGRYQHEHQQYSLFQSEERR